MSRVCSKLLICATFVLSHASVGMPDGNLQNRSGKTAYAAYEVIGLTMMPIGGLRLGYFVNPNLVGEVSYLTRSAKLGSFETKKQLIEAKAKYFFGDSFYADGGFAHESWDAKYSVLKSGSTISTSELSGKVKNTGIDLDIGNQWQWDGFTLGCDWIGYFLSQSSSASYGSASDLDAADKKSEEDSLKSRLSGSSLHLTRFYIGWSF